MENRSLTPYPHSAEGLTEKRISGQGRKKAGRGSLEQDGSLALGAMEEEEQADGRSMISDAGKGQCHAHKTVVAQSRRSGSRLAGEDVFPQLVEGISCDRSHPS